MKEQTAFCLKCLVLACVITLIRSSSLTEKKKTKNEKKTTHSNSFILVSNIIDCCQSLHPHLRDSIYLNVTNVQSLKKKKKEREQKWKINAGGIDYLLPDFCMISPASLKKHKASKSLPLLMSAASRWNIYRILRESRRWSLTSACWAARGLRLLVASGWQQPASGCGAQAGEPVAPTQAKTDINSF